MQGNDCFCSIEFGSPSVKITTMWCARYNVAMRTALRNALRSAHCGTRSSWLKLLLRSRTVNILFSVFHLATMPTAKIIHGRKLMNEIRACSNGGKMTGKAGVLGKTPVPTIYAPQIPHEHSFCHHSTTKELFPTRGIIQKFVVIWLRALMWQKNCWLVSSRPGNGSQLWFFRESSNPENREWWRESSSIAVIDTK